MAQIGSSLMSSVLQLANKKVVGVKIDDNGRHAYIHFEDGTLLVLTQENRGGSNAQGWEIS